MTDLLTTLTIILSDKFTGKIDAGEAQKQIMNTTIEVIHEERYVDKSNWPKGQWNDEPDKLHFVDRQTGMDCLIVRGPSGALCGYVAVEEGHPAFGADYNRVQVSVHGGLTYASACQEDGKICHVPRTGKPDHVYWLGFDCAHSGDLCPSYYRPGLNGGHYCNFTYVIRECQSLAETAFHTSTTS
jgi:hypothetical protein